MFERIGSMTISVAPIAIYPGAVLVPGSTDHASILLVQKQLNFVGCGPVQEDGVFGAETSEAVQHFQSRSFDNHGLPLVVDGSVGPMTWGALFGQPSPIVIEPATPLQGKTLEIAAGEIGVMESPLGSNRGPRVDQYLRYVDLDPATGSYPWCAAFASWCFGQASTALEIADPAPKTAGALDFWNRAGLAGLRRVSPSEAVANPNLVTPGMVFILSTGGGSGHVGLVEQVQGVVLTTIEGNTNDNGSREGIGVYRHNGRRIAQVNCGFVDCR
jgi:hypothetical protein